MAESPVLSIGRALYLWLAANLHPCYRFEDLNYFRRIEQSEERTVGTCRCLHESLCRGSTKITLSLLHHNYAHNHAQGGHALMQ